MLNGFHVGFSEDIQQEVSEPCAKCKNPNTKWHPWPGLWLCDPCFLSSSSEEFDKIIERLEVVTNESDKK